MITRREFVKDMALAGAASVFGFGSSALAAEPRLETTHLRLPKPTSLCTAPQYVAEELLRADGFTDIQYTGEGVFGGGLQGAQAMGAGKTDIGMNFAAPLVMALDDGAPLMLLGGVHAGCFELFASERVRSIGDLKGKAIATIGVGSTQHVFLSSILASVGLDPNKDVKWVNHKPGEVNGLFAESKVDAVLAFPPDGLNLRQRGTGRVILNSASDRPWSQYFCCMVAANKEFARRNPEASKRALRAILKASELCAANPEFAASAYMKQGFKPNPDVARQAIRELPYGKWREYNPEETVRFYALRLREANMVKGSPQKLIAQGTDWRTLNELKKELKA